MPSIEELLEQAENETSAIEPVNDILEIDPETRTVLIPDTEIIFGVEADQRAERKYFRCPKIVGNNIDLSELEIYVIFQNAGGSDEENRDAYHVQDLEDTGDGYVTFSWELTEKVTRYVGQVSFVVVATRTLSDGTIQNRWSTTIATGKSLIGLQTGMSENEQQQASDLYTQLITELNANAETKKSEITSLTNEKKSLLENTGTNQKNLVESEGTKQIQAVENKGTATLATIPEDYTALNTSVNDLNDLIHTKAPAIVEEATSGTEITVKDSAEGMRLQGMNVYGKSWQKTTTGKNLSSIKNCQLSTNIVESDIVPWTKKDKIYFSCDTENVENSKVYCFFMYYDENKTKVGANGVSLQADGTRKEVVFGGKHAGSDSSDVDLTTVEYVSLRVGLQSSSIPTSFIDNIMLCDEANQPYEPYTGGKPSPSPDYPQEIESVGRVLSTGVQLINFMYYAGRTGYANGITFQFLNDGSVLLNGTATNKEELDIITISGSAYDNYLDAGQYFLSGAKSNSGVSLQVWKDGNSKIAEDSGSGVSFVYAEREHAGIFVSVKSGTVLKDFLIKPMLNFGKSALPFEPYTGGVPALYQKDVEVELIGKNLFDISQAYGYNCSVVNGKVMQKNADTKNLEWKIQMVNSSNVILQEVIGDTNQRVTFSVEVKSDEIAKIKYGLNGTKVDTLVIYKKNVLKSGKTYTIDCNLINSTQGSVEFDNIMLNEGDTALPYEPYHEPQSLPIKTPTGLPAIPVPSGTSGIKYTDADGQAWIADEIDFARGKYIRRVWQAEFDGSEDEEWARYSARTGWVNNNGLPQVMKARTGFCNEKKVGVLDNDEIQLGSKSKDDNKMFYPNSKYYDTSLSDYGLSNWKAHLSANPLKIMTYLDNPIETDLSEEQIQAYKAVHTNKPTTIISNDADAWMDASYAADTRIWIENKVKEIVTS